MSFFNNQKGQSALEYLMTYGWALVVIVIVIAALVSLNIFNINTAPNTCVFKTVTGIVYDGAHAYRANGTFELKILNSTGKKIELVDFNVDNTPLTFSDVNVASGEKTIITGTDGPTGNLGEAYAVEIALSYNYTDQPFASPLRTTASCSGTYQ